MAGSVIGAFGLLAPMQSAARATLWINGLMLVGALVLVFSSIGSAYVQCCYAHSIGRDRVASCLRFSTILIVVPVVCMPQVGCSR